MIIAILTGLVVALANVLAVYLLWRLFIRFLRSYFEPHGDTPSQFAQVCEIIIDRFLVKFNYFMKASLGGQRSVEARNEKRIDEDIVRDMAGQASPLLGALIEAYPALAKRVAKNPALVPMALKALEKWSGAAGVAGPEPTGPSSSGDNGRDYMRSYY